MGAYRSDKVYDKSRISHMNGKNESKYLKLKGMLDQPEDSCPICGEDRDEHIRRLRDTSEGHHRYKCGVCGAQWTYKGVRVDETRS